MPGRPAPAAEPSAGLNRRPPRRVASSWRSWPPTPSPMPLAGGGGGGTPPRRHRRVRGLEGARLGRRTDALRRRRPGGGRSGGATQPPVRAGGRRDSERDCLFPDTSALVVRRSRTSASGASASSSTPAARASTTGGGSGWPARRPLRARLVRAAAGARPRDELSLAERDERKAVAGLFSAFTAGRRSGSCRAAGEMAARRRRGGSWPSSRCSSGSARACRPAAFARTPSCSASSGCPTARPATRPGLSASTRALDAPPGPGAHRRRAGGAHGRPRDPRLPDRAGAGPGARRAARVGGANELDHPAFRIGTVDGDRNCASCCAGATWPWSRGTCLASCPSWLATDKVLVADVYDPIDLEQLASPRGATPGEEDILA